jgi:hypothetical protein
MVRGTPSRNEHTAWVMNMEKTSAVHSLPRSWTALPVEWGMHLARMSEEEPQAFGCLILLVCVTSALAIACVLKGGINETLIGFLFHFGFRPLRCVLASHSPKEKKYLFVYALLTSASDVLLAVALLVIHEHTHALFTVIGAMLTLSASDTRQHWRLVRGPASPLVHS